MAIRGKVHYPAPPKKGQERKEPRLGVSIQKAPTPRPLELVLEFAAKPPEDVSAQHQRAICGRVAFPLTPPLCHDGRGRMRKGMSTPQNPIPREAGKAGESIDPQRSWRFGEWPRGWELL